MPPVVGGGDTAMILVQLVPWLPPALEGVGGYAAALGAALARCGIDSRFLVGDPGWLPAADHRAAAADFAGERLAERSAAALAHQLAASGATVVLVHYANYGYQRRGYPAWLVRGVCRWRAGAPGRRLVTYFHEVYASGPPWRSSFWVSPLQRRLAARLLGASDGAATSLGLYGRMLARWRPACEVWVTPVFSTIGEPAAVPPPGERLPRAMLVFGGAGNRQRAFGEQRAALAAACRALEVEEILDLGPPLAELPARLDGLPVRPLGALPAAAASAVLLRSYAGFLGYPASFLAKSTVFAAYCAHGLVPVCAWRRRQPPEAGERPPFWDAGAEPPPADPAGLAALARTWYGGHDLASQAVRFRALLAGVAGVTGLTGVAGRP
ncbi:MAG TPA: glycosyltransferase family 1 protein [Thermoanaerobaculia bacterium]|nr:glycosyltransferase family 1 protein [Thermoanaerobaculia bacterium]